MEFGYHQAFTKKLEKIPVKIRMRFIERRNLFKAEPFHPLLNNHSVAHKFPGCRSINVTGDYRALFKEQGNLVVFVNIDTHSELYG